MKCQDQSQYLCKSVFKSGKSITSTKEVTQMWINLINQIEKSKEISPTK